MEHDEMQGIYLSTDRLDRFIQQCHEASSSEMVLSLKAEGDDALSVGPFSVTDKSRVPPSGDKHDFLRMPTYAWPNPDTPNGLPYIIRDGEAGPGCREPDYDQRRLGEFTAAVRNLAWAALATGMSAYAEHAVELLRVWFVDPSTAMNPNLTYSKYTAGDEAPYRTGVIATHTWVEMIQAVGILAGTEAWSSELGDGLRTWFSDYILWL